MTASLPGDTVTTPLDVLIVGAGVSGLHAAYRLQRAGRRVRVLEARPFVGGRLRSAEPTDGVHALDLGASWFWPGEARVAGLLTELGLSGFPHHERGDALFDGPDGVSKLPPGAMASGASRIRGGYAAVTEALARRLTPGSLVLDFAVEAVRSDARGLHVRTRHGETPAAWVLLALPPALAVHAIGFEPPLPPGLAALAARTPVWMGDTVKTVVTYSHAFWRDDGRSGAAFSPRGPLQEIHDLSAPCGTPGALFGFARLSGPRDRAPGREAVLAQLSRLFGPRAADPIGFESLDWSREPATHPPGAGAARRLDLFGHPGLAGPWGASRLLCCSCETHPGHGHVEDALAASQRAVDAVLRAG